MSVRRWSVAAPRVTANNRCMVGPLSTLAKVTLANLVLDQWRFHLHQGQVRKTRSCWVDWLKTDRQWLGPSQYCIRRLWHLKNKSLITNGWCLVLSTSRPQSTESHCLAQSKPLAQAKCRKHSCHHKSSISSLRRPKFCRPLRLTRVLGSINQSKATGHWSLPSFEKETATKRHLLRTLSTLIQTPLPVVIQMAELVSSTRGLRREDSVVPIACHA